MKWTKGKHYDNLTITIFSRNVKSLCYPVYESLASTIPLGCRYLVGDASSDGSRAIWEDLKSVIPLEIVDLKWALDKEPGWKAVAIGIATQQTIEKSETPFVYNLQLSEVLDAEAVDKINEKDEINVASFWIRHFYGTMNIGGRAYHGYGDAPRIFRKTDKFDATDGAWPNNYDGGYPAIQAHVNRYGYCWLNTIIHKNFNKNTLYDGQNNTMAGAVAFHTHSKDPKNHNYPRDGHPDVVKHLIDLDNYDLAASKEWFNRFIGQ